MLKIRISNRGNNPCDGFSALAMVILLLLLGSLLMVELSNLTSLVHQRVNYEKQYYLAENSALSATEWATSLVWSPPGPSWQCQTLMAAHLTACIKMVNLSTGSYTLIRGQSATVQRYRLATYYAEGEIAIDTGHWLDYCPANKSSDCD